MLLRYMALPLLTLAMLTGCTTIPRDSISPEQRAIICHNLRGEIISNNEFTVTTAASPSPMQGYSPNRNSELYRNYDQYHCDT